MFYELFRKLFLLTSVQYFSGQLKAHGGCRQAELRPSMEQRTYKRLLAQLERLKTWMARFHGVATKYLPN